MNKRHKFGPQKITDGKTILTITHWIYLTNGWKYFVTDEHYMNQIYTCLVDGHDVEIGDVDLDELKPHIWKESTNLSLVSLPQNWRWVRKNALVSPQLKFADLELPKYVLVTEEPKEPNWPEIQYERELDECGE